MSRRNGQDARHLAGQQAQAEAAAAALATAPVTTFPSVQIEVTPEGDGARTMHVVTPLGIYRFPMTNEYAQGLSRRLLAPSVPQ